MGEKTNGYNILDGKREGKRPLGIPKCEWENKMNIDLEDTIQIRALLIALMNVPSSIRARGGYILIGFSRILFQEVSQYEFYT
jgi:hypothetical protein